MPRKFTVKTRDDITIASSVTGSDGLLVTIWTNRSRTISLVPHVFPSVRFVWPLLRPSISPQSHERQIKINKSKYKSQTGVLVAYRRNMTSFFNDVIGERASFNKFRNSSMDVINTLIWFLTSFDLNVQKFKLWEKPAFHITLKRYNVNDKWQSHKRNIPNVKIIPKRTCISISF